MLFADLRGSTAMAERITPSEFAQTLNRFYASVTDVLIRTDAYIDQLVDIRVRPYQNVGDRGIEAVQRLGELTGGDPLGHCCRPAEVGEQHGQLDLGTTRVPAEECRSEVAETRIVGAAASAKETHQRRPHAFERRQAVLAPFRPREQPEQAALAPHDGASREDQTPHEFCTLPISGHRHQLPPGTFLDLWDWRPLRAYPSARYATAPENAGEER